MPPNLAPKWRSPANHEASVSGLRSHNDSFDPSPSPAVDPLPIAQAAPPSPAGYHVSSTDFRAVHIQRFPTLTEGKSGSNCRTSTGDSSSLASRPCLRRTRGVRTQVGALDEDEAAGE